MSLPNRQDNWVADLAFEVALGYYSPEELQLKFELSDVQYDSACRLPEFQKAVSGYRREIDEQGTEFKLKARKLASELLPELAFIAADDTASHADRISAIREMCRLAGYGKEETAGSQQAPFQINIQFSQDAAPTPHTAVVSNQ
jgi:hypothetical protein